MTISGKDFLKLRTECEGLKYLLDGNNFDMDNGYNGVSKFESTSFRNFFHATGAITANYIVLKCGAGRCSIEPDGRASPGTTIPPKSENDLPQTTLDSTIILSHKPNEQFLFYYDVLL